MQETEFKNAINDNVEKLQEVFSGDNVVKDMDDRLSELELEGHTLSRRTEISKRSFDRVVGQGKYYAKRKRRKGRK